MPSASAGLATPGLGNAVALRTEKETPEQVGTDSEQEDRLPDEANPQGVQHAGQDADDDRNSNGDHQDEGGRMSAVASHSSEA